MTLRWNRVDSLHILVEDQSMTSVLVARHLATGYEVLEARYSFDWMTGQMYPNLQELGAAVYSCLYDPRMLPTADEPGDFQLCSCCNTWKRQNEFSPSAREGSGKRNARWCRECAAEYRRNRRNGPKRQQIMEQHRLYYAAKRRRNPQQSRAWNAINNAKRSRRNPLPKAGVCCVCGEPAVERHHQDYDVKKHTIPYCAVHHRQLHIALQEAAASVRQQLAAR